jgi:hypothetical protein
MLLADAYPSWPNAGAYAARTIFIKELYGPQWVNLLYEILQNTTSTAVKTNAP